MVSLSQSSILYKHIYVKDILEAGNNLVLGPRNKVQKQPDNKNFGACEEKAQFLEVPLNVRAMLQGLKICTQQVKASKSQRFPGPMIAVPKVSAS